MTARRFPLPLYLAELVVFHGSHAAFASAGKRCHDATLRGIIERMVDHDAPPLGSTEHGMSVVPGKPVRRFVVIFVESAQPVTEKRLTGVHEATHAAGAILDGIEHEMRPANDEPYAYLVEWITRCVWDACGI